MGSKSSSIWGDKSLWNLSNNSPNSTSSMQTANGSFCSGGSNDGKDSFWQSTQSSPISSQYNNLTSLWGCSPIKGDAHEESLGSIWNIPTTSSPIAKKPDVNFEAPLPPPMSYNQKTQPQMLRPQDIGGSVWSGLTSNTNGMGCTINNSNGNSSSNNNNNGGNHNNKVKDSVGSLWAHPTPPNLSLALQSQNYNNLLSTNTSASLSSSKFQSQQMKSMHNNMSQQQAMLPPPSSSSSMNGGQNGYGMNPQSMQLGANSCNGNNNNMQLFSDEFLSYLNMIN